MEPVQPPILSYEDINSAAEDFLKCHQSDERLPVQIEEIVEFNLKMDIVPFPELQRNYDIEGFISRDLTWIYVDDFIYSNRPARYRFTLAHEVGHLILHRDLIKSIHPPSVADWKDFILSVDEEVYGWMEWQAYSFAGLVLVPRKFLVRDLHLQIKALKDKIELVKSKNLSRESYQEYVIEAIANKLIKTYDVSVDVLKKRIAKEIEKGTVEVP